MKATLCFVPPGGGETNYGFDVELPGIPQPGDYLSFIDQKKDGTCDFIVRRVHWFVRLPDQNDQQNTFEGLTIECEFALSEGSSDSHKKSYEGYKGQGRPLKKFDISCY